MASDINQSSSVNVRENFNHIVVPMQLKKLNVKTKNEINDGPNIDTDLDEEKASNKSSNVMQTVCNEDEKIDVPRPGGHYSSMTTVVKASTILQATREAALTALNSKQNLRQPQRIIKFSDMFNQLPKIPNATILKLPTNQSLQLTKNTKSKNGLIDPNTIKTGGQHLNSSKASNISVLSKNNKLLNRTNDKSISKLTIKKVNNTINSSNLQTTEYVIEKPNAITKKERPLIITSYHPPINNCSDKEISFIDKDEDFDESDEGDIIKCIDLKESPNSDTDQNMFSRAKRSKSFNSENFNLQDYNVTTDNERRHSTTSESNKLSPNSLRLIKTIFENSEKENEIIDLQSDSSDNELDSKEVVILESDISIDSDPNKEDDHSLQESENKTIIELDNHTKNPQQTSLNSIVNVACMLQNVKEKSDIKLPAENNCNNKVERNARRRTLKRHSTEEKLSIAPIKLKKISSTACYPSHYVKIDNIKKEESSDINVKSNSLLCEENLSTSHTSSSLSSNNNLSSPDSPLKVLPLKSNGSVQNVNMLSSMLKMLSTFNMLTWKERIGIARDTTMRFQLNEFNILQLMEQCPPRYNIHTAFEKPIYDRQSKPINKNSNETLLYLCSRCHCHGYAEDFLAPKFCSLECLRRKINKRLNTDEESLPVSLEKEKVQKKKPLLQSDLPNSTTSKHFRWTSYLIGRRGGPAAPVHLFLNPFPTGPNCFQIGMKLEAIDPQNCSLFCVCTVVEIHGFRLKLNFDGYNSIYDFWINADSMDIFPPGWCEKTNRILQPPRKYTLETFTWSTYLAKHKAIPAHRQLFTHLNSSSLPNRNSFKNGMQLEAEDLNDTGKYCVASVADVLDYRIRVHFDGWDDCYDYWVDINSPYIHPVGTVKRKDQYLIVPPEYESSTFNWFDYMKEKGSIPANVEYFAERDAIEFVPSMKLEVVDPCNTALIRPATIIGCVNHRLRLHIDCWPVTCCFWADDDSPDLHPIGWCETTGHDIEPPPGFLALELEAPCTTFGCRGIGNFKDLTENVHFELDACPYTIANWGKKPLKPLRVEKKMIVKHTSHGNHQNLKKIEENSGDDIYKPTLLNFETQTGDKKTEELTKKKSSALMQIRDSTPVTSIKIETQSNNQNLIENRKNEDDIFNRYSLKVCKELLNDYGPRLLQNHAIWQRNSSFGKRNIAKNPLLWSTEETKAFVGNILNSEQCSSTIMAQDIDGTALLMLSQSDLMDLLGFKLGNAIKLHMNILQLRTIVLCKFNNKGNCI